MANRPASPTVNAAALLLILSLSLVACATDLGTGQDVAIRMTKTARAESEEEAQRLVEETRLLTRENAEGAGSSGVPNRWSGPGDWKRVK